jgi:hypothetical protein
MYGVTRRSAKCYMLHRRAPRAERAVSGRDGGGDVTSRARGEMLDRVAREARRWARRLIRAARAGLDRLEAILEPDGQGGGLVAPQPPPGEEESLRRWWSLLADVEARGGRLSAEEFRELARSHGYQPRGVGGFFSGANATMRREGDIVEITARGRRDVLYWAPTFRG